MTSESEQAPRGDLEVLRFPTRLVDLAVHFKPSFPRRTEGDLSEIFPLDFMQGGMHDAFVVVVAVVAFLAFFGLRI